MFGPSVDRYVEFGEQCHTGHPLPRAKMMQLHVENRGARCIGSIDESLFDPVEIIKPGRATMKIGQYMLAIIGMGDLPA